MVTNSIPLCLKNLNPNKPVPDLLKAKNSNVRLSFFKGGSVFIKSVTFRVQTAPFDKITIDFCRSRRCLHDSDLPGAKKTQNWQNIQKISLKISKNPQKSMDFHGDCVEPMWRPKAFQKRRWSDLDNPWSGLGSFWTGPGFLDSLWTGLDGTKLVQFGKCCMVRV